jgi:hypothetical protein
MIAPPPVLPEEPAAVTPHGGFRGGQKPAMAALPVRTARTVRREEGSSPTGPPYRSGIGPGLRQACAGMTVWLVRFARTMMSVSRAARCAMNDGRDSDRRAGHLPEGMTRR